MPNIYADFTESIPFEKRLELIRSAGFDGVMLGFSEENKYTQYELCRNAGLAVENVHSPFDRMNALWEKREDSCEILERTLECVEICAENGVNKVIVHPTDGLVPPEVTDFGTDNFSRIVERAESRGVTVLFENIQLPSFLDVLFERFGQMRNVGFCYDVGHENCFTRGENRLEKHGSLLGALHIHDNEGLNDGHMIPFDGNIDYELFLKRLAGLKKDIPLSLEMYMNKSSLYEGVSPEDFVNRAFRAAMKLQAMYERILKDE